MSPGTEICDKETLSCKADIQLLIPTEAKEALLMAAAFNWALRPSESLSMVFSEHEKNTPAIAAVSK